MRGYGEGDMVKGLGLTQGVRVKGLESTRAAALLVRQKPKRVED